MKTLKNKKTRKFSILNFQFSILILLSAFCFLPLTSFSQGEGGTAGPLTWNLDNGVLTISGTGNMPAYEHFWDLKEEKWYTSAPWGRYSDSITAVAVQRGVTNIGKDAFFHCTKINSVDIANSVVVIERSAFCLCTGLISVVLPSGITSIEGSAFNSSGLVSITLPSSITSIGYNAIGWLSHLNSIINLNPVPITINSDIFENINLSACTLKVPMGSVEAYQRAEVWKEFNIMGINVEVSEFEDPKSDSGEQLTIYPNPNTGTCNIVIPEEFLYESFLTLSIYDAGGILVQQTEILSETEDLNIKLDQKAKGIYMAVLSNGKRSYRGKIVFK